jgi:hypothetical protein
VAIRSGQECRIIFQNMWKKIKKYLIGYLCYQLTNIPSFGDELALIRVQAISSYGKK